MPYPNEHSCRLDSPDDFQEDSFRRIERGTGKDKITIIIGKLKGKTTTTAQAYRYDKDVWTEKRARTHCDEAGGIFEPAEVETKEAKMLDLTTFDTLGKLYAAHNRIHAQYVDARHTIRTKANMQEEHEAIVRRILDWDGKHIAKGDTLDDTLPQELKEPIKLHYLSDSIELDKKTKLSEIQILRTGTFYHSSYGKFTITDETLKTMVNNFNKATPKAPTELVVDYEHLSAIDITDPKQGKAAGWVKGLTFEEGKLFATVEWTEEAAEAISKKEFRFISPEFALNYKDPETGKRIGPTLMAVALTNRPFLEGMEPVVLSKSLGTMIFSEESLYEQTDAIYTAYKALQPQAPEVAGGYVRDIYDDYVVVEEEGKLYKIPYTKVGDEITFDMAAKQEVTLIKEYITLSEEGLTERGTKYIDDLPDSSFAYVAPGGEKDKGGMTVPRSLRYLPYKGEDGKVDLMHLRNALAQLAKTELSPEAKIEARQVLAGAAQKASVGKYAEKLKEGEPSMNEEQQAEMRKILGLAEDADMLEAVKALKAKSDDDAVKLTDADQRATAAQKKLDEAKAETVVTQALTERKITPKMREWALKMVLTKPEAFTDFVTVAETVGPDPSIKGKDPLTETTIALSEFEKTIAKKLGVKEEDILKLKQADKEAEPE